MEIIPWIAHCLCLPNNRKFRSKLDNKHSTMTMTATNRCVFAVEYFIWIYFTYYNFIRVTHIKTKIKIMLFLLWKTALFSENVHMTRHTFWFPKLFLTNFLLCLCVFFFLVPCTNLICCSWLEITLTATTTKEKKW